MKCDNIHLKNKQFTISDRESISVCLSRDLNLTDTAKFLHCAISSVKREIDRHKQLVISQKYKNVCGFKLTCTYTAICGNSRCTHLCSKCIKKDYSCNSICSKFTTEPQCKLLKKHCGVCNGCPNFKTCSLNKFIYNSSIADSAYHELITIAHEGKSISLSQAKELAEFLKEQLKKNISIAAIKSLYPEKIPMSEQTIYNWVDEGFLPGIDNILLPRKVKYSPRKTKKEQNDSYEYLTGRFYEDFNKFISENKLIDIVEMDTVEGCNHDSFIMTLLFRKSNFMLAFKLKDHTSQSIVEVFDHIKSFIGESTFAKFFKVILTDRGSEFKDPVSIENNAEGKKIINVFYCDSRQSQQKGKIEKNHEELRKIFPKGTSFVNVSQDKLNRALNMVNSYPREILNFSSPYDLFSIYGDVNILALNDSKKISKYELDMSPRNVK